MIARRAPRPGRGFLRSAALFLALAPVASTGTAETPLPTTLREQTEARLVQVDVTVLGEASVVSNLTTEDFELRTNIRRVREFTLDRFCEAPSNPGTAAATGTRRERRRDNAVPRTTSLPATYLLYFDQPHLTLTGRQRAIDVAQDLLPRLLVGGSRAMIVSNAAQQIVVAPMTDDVDLLHAALEQLQRDRTQWDLFATNEDQRVADVVDVLNQDTDPSRAISRARSYQREERWYTDKHLRRLTLCLSRLGDARSPKAVVYFGDTLRQNPGEHYLNFFGSNILQGNPLLMRAQSGSFGGAVSFDALVNEASAQGIRVYTIEAAGLSAPVDSLQPAARVLEQTLAIPASSRVRFRDAKTTLSGLARETGGRAFLNGVRPERIAHEILADLSCMYLLSFDPGTMSLDRPIRLVVRSRRDDITLRSRGRVVVKSESARTTTRLLSALAAGDRQDAGLQVASELIPIAFADGRYRALLQVRVPPTSLIATTWDLGASLLHDDNVYEELSGRFATVAPGTTLVLESEVSLSPGDHQIYAIAHETTGGLVLSDRNRFSWPDPRGRAVIAPLSVAQPAQALFSRDGESRRDGSIARAAGEPIDVALPTALLGLICRGKRGGALFEAHRSLVGASVVEFPVLKLDLRAERCAQLRDLVPAGMLAPGGYRYEIQIRSDDETLEQASRPFEAVSREAS